MNRRLKIFRIDADMLFVMFREGVHQGFKVVERGIPEDAELVNVRMAFHGCSLELCIRSSEFPEVPAKNELTYYSPVCERLKEPDDANKT